MGQETEGKKQFYVTIITSPKSQVKKYYKMCYYYCILMLRISSNIMNAGRFSHDGPTFFKTFLYSFLFHTIILSLLLSIPIRSGGASSNLFERNFVFLITEEPAVKAGRLQGAVATITDNAARLMGASATSAEDRASSDAPQTDMEEAPVTEQGGKVAEVAETLLVKDPHLETSPVMSEGGPVFEEKKEKQEAYLKDRMNQPVSSDLHENVEKTDIPEKSLPAARNLPAEKAAMDLADIKKIEKKPDISIEKAPQTTDNKTVIISPSRIEQENEVRLAKIAVPVRKQNGQEREVTVQTMLPQARTGQKAAKGLQQKAVPETPLPVPAAPEPGKGATASLSSKEITSPKLPDIGVSPGANLSVSEEKPLQDISQPLMSPEMTLTAAEEKGPSQASEKVGKPNPPALQAKNAAKNDTPKADRAITKQNSETAGDPGQPKAVIIPNEAREKKKSKSGEGEENLLSKDHAIVQNNEKAPLAKNGNSGVVATRTSSPARSPGSESKTGHKKDVGADKTAVSSPTQTTQKPVESGGSLNYPLKQAHGPLAESAESGSQKPAIGQRDDGKKSLAPAGLAGSETDKRNANLHLADNRPGPLAPVSGVSAERPSPGTEVKLPIARAAGGSPPNTGGAAIKSDSDTKDQAQSVEGKTAEPEKSTVAPDPGKETGKNSIGIPVSEALIQKDIKIELVLESADMPDVLTQLFRKSHPGPRGKIDRGKQETVEGTVETRGPVGAAKTGTRLFAVTKAEKGVYTLVLENKGERTRTVDVIFRLFEGREKERSKEYKSRELLPGDLLRFVFIMPEAFFWDDEERFSGSVEDSRSITKFHSESGLVWKEEK